jgi:hypothetical protein
MQQLSRSLEQIFFDKATKGAQEIYKKNFIIHHFFCNSNVNFCMDQQQNVVILLSITLTISYTSEEYI